MRRELTDGTIIIDINICDCGLTGGCEKCNPIILTAYKIWNYNEWNKITAKGKTMEQGGVSEMSEMRM